MAMTNRNAQNIYDCHILLVDDSAELQEMVEDILRREGYRHIDAVSSCRECQGYLEGNSPDIIILDIGLPDGDGFGLMQRIRLSCDTPVLFLSARDEDNDRLFGLGLGADDYITKPFLPRELTLRITAILKRTYFSQNRPARDLGVLELGSRRVDLNGGTIAVGEKSIPMTAKELAILGKLSENRGNIVTFDALSQAVWGDDYYGYENTMMVHIRRLREKLEENPSEPRWLLTVRGVGYKLAK